MATLKAVRERIKALEGDGFTVVRHEQTKAGHFRIWISHEGTEYFLIVPSSPSDHRATKRMLADARHLVSGVSVQRTKK